MIITKTPFRMSFFGGGTDMEEYFKVMVDQLFLQPSISIAMLMLDIYQGFLIIHLKFLTQKQKE